MSSLSQVSLQTGAVRSRFGLTLYLACGVGLATLMYWQVVSSMVVDWWQEEGNSYGFLVPPLAVYVAWSRRRSILAEPAFADGRGLLLTASASLVYLVGRLAVESFLTRISLILLLAGFIWTFWGVRRLRTLSFPLIVLASMVPLPAVVYYQVTAPLQLYSSSLATGVVRLLGLTIYQDGNIIYLPSTSLGVAEACSGLHSALSLFITALLLGYIECSRAATRIALVAIAVPIAIFFNVIRIAGTAFLADANPDLATGFYHSFSGWLVYLAGSAALFAACLAFRRIFDGRTPA